MNSVVVKFIDVAKLSGMVKTKEDREEPQEWMINVVNYVQCR